MPRCIIKIKDKYFEWSTIVDAPVTYAMTKKELEEEIKLQHGLHGLKELPGRLERVKKYGTSFQIPTKLKDLLMCNRAGDNEEELTEDEIYKKYSYIHGRSSK